MPPTKKPSVTVVMRSKNSDWVIGQALAGLFSQNFRDFELPYQTSDPYKLIIDDDGKTLAQHLFSNRSGDGRRQPQTKIEH